MDSTFFLFLQWAMVSQKCAWLFLTKTTGVEETIWRLSEGSDIFGSTSCEIGDTAFTSQTFAEFHQYNRVERATTTVVA